MVSEPLCSRVRWLPPRTQIKTTTQINNHQWTKERMLQLFVWLTFCLNSKPFTYTVLLLIKMVSLKCNIRWSVRVYNLPSFQVAGHPNKMPNKIQSLSLFIGSGRWKAARTLAFLVSKRKKHYNFALLLKLESIKHTSHEPIELHPHELTIHLFIQYLKIKISYLLFKVAE